MFILGKRETRGKYYPGVRSVRGSLGGVGGLTSMDSGAAHNIRRPRRAVPAIRIEVSFSKATSVNGHRHCLILPIETFIFRSFSHIIILFFWILPSGRIIYALRLTITPWYSFSICVIFCRPPRRTKCTNNTVREISSSGNILYDIILLNLKTAE